MSPTSYQTAPPRSIMLTNGLGSVKQRSQMNQQMVTVLITGVHEVLFLAVSEMSHCSCKQ